MPIGSAPIGSVGLVSAGRQELTTVGELERFSIQGPEGQGVRESGEAPKATFEDVFTRMVDGAAAADRAADAQVDALAVGASDDIHGTMISVKEAEISLKLVASVRNKLLDAFHELWRTSV